MQIELDRNEMRILNILQRHGDLSAAQVAEKAGMSVSTCWRHIHRLEDLGIIRERVAILDREKVGLNVMVFAQVKLQAQGRDALMKFEQAVKRHPEVLDCYTVMGDQDFLLRIVEKDIKSYEAFFLDQLSRFPHVQSVNSKIVLSTIKESTALPLPTK